MKEGFIIVHVSNAQNSVFHLFMSSVIIPLRWTRLQFPGFQSNVPPTRFKHCWIVLPVSFVLQKDTEKHIYSLFVAFH